MPGSCVVHDPVRAGLAVCDPFPPAAPPPLPLWAPALGSQQAQQTAISTSARAATARLPAAAILASRRALRAPCLGILAWACAGGGLPQL